MKNTIQTGDILKANTNCRDFAFRYYIVKSISKIGFSDILPLHYIGNNLSAISESILLENFDVYRVIRHELFNNTLLKYNKTDEFFYIKSRNVVNATIASTRLESNKVISIDYRSLYSEFTIYNLLPKKKQVSIKQPNEVGNLYTLVKNLPHIDIPLGTICRISWISHNQIGISDINKRNHIYGIDKTVFLEYFTESDKVVSKITIDKGRNVDISEGCTLLKINKNRLSYDGIYMCLRCMTPFHSPLSAVYIWQNAIIDINGKETRDIADQNYSIDVYSGVLRTTNRTVYLTLPEIHQYFNHNYPCEKNNGHLIEEYHGTD